MRGVLDFAHQQETRVIVHLLASLVPSPASVAMQRSASSPTNVTPTSTHVGSGGSKASIRRDGVADNLYPAVLLCVS